MKRDAVLRQPVVILNLRENERRPHPMDSRDAKTKYHASTEWKNFARRAQKNPFMKAYHITVLQHGVCPVCGKRFIKSTYELAHGHHTDYDHTCVTAETIEYPRPSEKRPNGTRRFPDCQTCARTSPESFLACASRIEYVHPGCHVLLHKSQT